MPDYNHVMNKMRVAFDLSMLYVDLAYRGGIWHYTLTLLRKLRRFRDLVDIVDFHIVKYASLSGHVLSILNFITVSKILKNKHVDLVYIPHPRALAHAMLPLFKPTVITIHDVHFLVAKTSTTYKLKLLPRYLPLTLDSYVLDNVYFTTVSNFSRDSIVEYLRIPNYKVRVVYPGVDEIFKPIQREKALSYIKERYGFDGPYILYVGAVTPRKGVLRLIKAYSIARGKYGVRAKVVFAGPRSMDIDLLIKYARYLGVGSDVVYLGYVPRGDLPYLMSGASVFVFLSSHEGFGLPPLEAMACGVPVIVSDIPVFREVVGDGGVLVNYRDYESVAKYIADILFNSELRRELAEKALRRASLFSWDNTARQMIQYWLEIIKSTY